MSQDRLTDKARLAFLAAGRAGQSTLGALKRTPFYRWRVLGPRPTEILFVPQDLRTSDASFITELEHGQMGLAGFVAELGGVCPFRIPPPSPVWEERLHNFSWLRHLRAARDEGGADFAKQYVDEWIALHGSPRGRPFEPAIVARRMISWLTNAGLFLEEADGRFYSAVLASLEMQMTHLAATYGETAPGYPRLSALTALVYAGLCIADQERMLALYEAAFLAELDKQILPYGGHVSRNTGILVELLLDLLPLTQCFVARDRKVPPRLAAAIARVFPWLRYMRLGDGQLTRFNGAGPMLAVHLATVLAYDETLTRLQPASPLGYLRLEAGPAVLVLDAGPPPPLELSTEAHAGCLSFELSGGPYPMIVNCGAPISTEQDKRRLARSTAAHSTLSIDGASSSLLVRSRHLDKASGTGGLSGPARVSSRIGRQPDGALDVEASHDGYLGRFGLIHRRSLRLAPSGERLDGCDRLGHPDANTRIKGDVAFGIHFHLHPDVECRLGTAPGTADLALADGNRWRLSMKGAASLALEESQFLAEAFGPRRSMQAVLRGRCLDKAEVHWRLERVKPA